MNRSGNVSRGEKSRPAIPEAIKRAVRRRCGFGCVICGLPVFQYDHMVEYSEVRAHEAENITLLCLAHHGEKSSKRLPRQRVFDANARPFNLSADLTGGHPLSCFYGNEFSFGLGTNRFRSANVDGSARGASFYIDGGPLLSARVEESEILVRAVFRDLDNKVVLIIRDNELKVAVGVWDVLLKGNRMTIWWGARNIGLDMLFEEDGLYVTRGVIYGNGLRCRIDSTGVFEMHTFKMEHCEFPGTSIHAGVGLPKNAGVDAGDTVRYMYDPPPAAFGCRPVV